MIEILPFLASGLFLGLISGISPGPMLTLVISETLKHNTKQGIKVAMAPLITDFPIIVVTMLLLSELTGLESVLGIISLLGAAFIMYLGYESITIKGTDVKIQNVNPRILRKAIIVNSLNPGPYIFWLTIGTPILFRSYQIGLFSAIIFLATFYIFLVGSKIIVAILVNKSRTFLKDKIYIWIMRGLGLSLFIFAYMFIVEALHHFDII